MQISRLLCLNDLNQYKVHAARFNQVNQPLDVFVRDKDEWHGWNEWRGKKNDFNRKFVLSFMDFYPERHAWLFGGIFEAINRHADRYEVRLCENGKDLIGRLKIKSIIPRGRSFLLESFYHEMEVVEVLRKPYVAEVFPGYDNISLDFAKLKIIFENDPLDWKTALSNIKGIYVFSDTSNGLKYVGKADGDSGIWSRWGQYISGGAGGNVELVKLIKQRGIMYALENFQMTLIEAYPWKTQDSTLNQREKFWKAALLTSRDKFGYNGN